MVEIKINSLEELPQAVDKFIEAMDDRTVFAFKGEMGCRQDNLHKSSCVACLGVEDMS